MGFEPVTSRCRCNSTTNSAMKPLSLGPHFLQFLPREIENNAYAKCLRVNKVYNDHDLLWDEAREIWTLCPSLFASRAAILLLAPLLISMPRQSPIFHCAKLER